LTIKSIKKQLKLDSNDLARLPDCCDLGGVVNDLKQRKPKDPFYQTPLTKEQLANLFTQLPEVGYPMPRKLSLNGLGLGDEQVSAIADFVQSPTASQLRQIDLLGNHFTQDGFQPLSSALKTHPLLRMNDAAGVLLEPAIKEKMLRSPRPASTNGQTFFASRVVAGVTHYDPATKKATCAVGVLSTSISAGQRHNFN
jgi:hypothetical protein